MRARRKDEGTVLLSTLLALSLMSAVTLGLLAALRGTVSTAQRLQDAAQADLYASGARDFALAQAARLASLDGPTRNAAVLGLQPIVLPFEGGAITAAVRDGTHCLRLSGLVGEGGTRDDAEVRRFAALLEGTGLGPTEAQAIAGAAADYADANSERGPDGAEDGVYLYRDPPHRTANTAFSSIWELRAVDGVTEDIFRAVRPFLCIGAPGEGSAFNIDTADARHLPVLAAVLAHEYERPRMAAQQLLEARPATGYGDAAAALAVLGVTPDRPPVAAAGGGDDGATAGPSLDGIAFSTDTLEVDALISFGSAERARSFRIALGEGGEAPQLVHRDFGRNALRPELTTPGEGVEP